MIVSILLALFLPCIGMSVFLAIYMCLLYYATSRHRPDLNPRLKPVTEQGLSPLELENLPKITGKELVASTECAVCLDEIVDEQPARLIPGCNHAFHLQCADTWLSKHRFCPLCRTKLDPQILDRKFDDCCIVREMSNVGRMKLGSQGMEVSLQGLGCMSMSAFYGPPKPEIDMISLIHHAIQSGVTFLNTSDIYGPHTNELLLGKALKGGVRDNVELATKGKVVVSGDPSHVRAACEDCLSRLNIDSIDLYYQHLIDSRLPIEITIWELKKLVEEGKIKYIGLSEASTSTIRRAHAIHPITAVQLEWSLWSRDVEEELIPTCRELGIGIVAYSPLGRGFFSSGTKLLENLTPDDYWKSLPRFQPENLQQNQTLFNKVNELAAKKGCTPSQLALSWLHHQGNDVCPIPGTTKIENFNQNIGALSIKLTPEEMTEIESLADSVKGDKYMQGVRTWKEYDTPPLSSWKAA